MPKILFTKHYSRSTIQENFPDFFKVESLDFIQTKFIDLEKIQTQINPEIHSYIVSSERAANHISTLDLKGDFYCVGRNATKILERANKKVRLSCGSAGLLIEAIQGEVFNAKKPTQNFTYFCSDIRRDEIPDGIKKLGHNLTEIITYKTMSKKVGIQKDFNAYVFFSPSGVKSFSQQYNIPQKATIFAIGKTTANTVFHILNREALIPEKPELVSLTQTIKTYFNA